MVLKHNIIKNTYLSANWPNMTAPIVHSNEEKRGKGLV